MLQLEDLVLAQGDFRLQADLAVPGGGRVAVLGPSGGGKSTLLAAIAGFIAPQRGRILWQGRDLAPLAPGARPVSMLFQDGNLFPHLTIERNLVLALDPRGRLTPERRARIEAALARVGLAGFGPRRPSALSGGQQSRAALARALLSERDLVLLDEPFAALGPGLRAEMLDLVTEVLGAAGRTILMVTHAPDDALRLGDLALVVDEGRAAAPTGVEALLRDPPPGLRNYLGH
ncbi:ATP-binding cassette domain-containing protein [Pseudoroseicyclus aestuarii]|uniref:Thiamine transport system ATP-binding protein n=1 Tax=Pseudoroseicyclus aestuarii TaxID=1795041 RepID=A0A318T7F3_9RHOB|nr:ATP-binding cassette domain-containing protein [Pseudoroseicyclus aestuarii]PYE84328.1 thiamine transport system ATP-binding protein [Pseudoroseicyclus aestuarii]